MSQGQKSSAATVLLLEADPSMRRLISLGLRHRGLEVIEANSLATISSTDLQSLDLLILDVDEGVSCDWTLLQTVQEQPELSSLPTVVLSWDPPLEEKSSSLTTIAQCVCVNKPFDARALHDGVDHLLLMRTVEKGKQLALAEAALLDAYRKDSSPSIWPVVTAAGVFLAMIGFLFQFVLTMIGLVIIVIGLLLWTIGWHSRIEAAPEIAFSVGK
ncbi:response regulator transcription factor [Dictyobacter kobayashii]|uniref:Response regulatory domain-containing protein n=1 Tax=Dictyobacter kobayashii TaxID=2014872 RepID=A0A402AG43_9CHLR|nr:response regulator transcription factor [Dictyobacter kobayashii]GCE18087.1 hypothetical protein KDK_18870 [Dictyobacter kobayashii]